MAALNTILTEVENLQDNELHQLIHLLVDKIHTPLKFQQNPPKALFGNIGAGPKGCGKRMRKPMSRN